eukprot:EG_transcript_25503
MATTFVSRRTGNQSIPSSSHTLKVKYDQLVSLQQVEEQRVLCKDGTSKTLCAHNHALRELKLKQSTERAAIASGLSRLHQNISMRENHLQVIEKHCDCQQASQSEQHLEIKNGSICDQRQKDVWKLCETMHGSLQSRHAKLQKELSEMHKVYSMTVFDAEDVDEFEYEQKVQALESQTQALSSSGFPDSSLLVWAKEYVGQCGEQFGDDLQRFLKAEDSLTEASAVETESEELGGPRDEDFWPALGALQNEAALDDDA